MNLGKDDYDEWVLRLYQAVVRPSNFRDFLAQLGVRLGGHIVALHAEDIMQRRGAIAMTVGISEDDLAGLQQRYVEFAHQNIWMQRGRAVLLRDGFVDSSTICEHREMAKTDYFRTLLAPIDIDHSLGILLSTSEQGGQAILTINRSGVRRPFTPDHHALISRLRPHLSQAFQMMWQQVWDEQTASVDLAALTQWPDPILIVDTQFNVLWNNSATERSAEHPDMPFIVRAGQISFSSPIDETRIQLLVAAACTLGRYAERLVLTRKSESENWVLSVLSYPASAIRSRLSVAGAALLIFRSSGGVGLDDTYRLMAMLNLTLAEAKLATALRSTRDLNAAADHCGISWHTARTHMKSLMAKAQSRKQTHLLRLIDLCLDLP